MSSMPIPPDTITDDEILAGLTAIVSQSLRIDPTRVTRESSLDALGAESIDLLEITLDVEHAFTVIMPEHSILDLASGVLGEGVVQRDGWLTGVGAALLRARLPEFDDETFGPGAAVGSLAPLFLRVDVWIRVIRGLLQATPRVCPAGHGPLHQAGPAQVRCPACAIVLDVPLGDDIGREWIRQWWAARDR